MGTVYGFLYGWHWRNPNQAPTDGLPAVHAEIFIPTKPGQGAPGAPAEFQAMHPFGSGRCLCCMAVTPAPKEISPAGLASLRRKRLTRRLQAKCPLFAEQLIAEELAKHPAYYAGDVDPGWETVEADKQEALATWRARTAFWLAHPNEVFIYEKVEA